MSNKLVSKITPQKSPGPEDSHDEFCQIFKEEIILISHKLFQKVEEGPPKAYGSRWRVLTKCSPLEEAMASYHYFFCDDSMNSLKRQIYMTLREESPRSGGV